MTATIFIDAKGRLVLPKKMRERAGIQSAAKLRAEAANGRLVLSAVEPSWAEELRAIERASGLPLGPEPKNAMQMVKRAIQRVRRNRK